MGETMNSGHLARLTPENVQSVTFRAARRGRRGLDHDHVREFCEQVEAELAQLANEREALRDEVRRLRQRALSVGELAGAQRDDTHVHAASILAQAQKTADRYIAEAQDYSRHLAEHARRRRDEVLADAQSQASRVLERARQEARPAGGSQLTGAGLDAATAAGRLTEARMADSRRLDTPVLEARPAEVTRADLTVMAAPVDLPAGGRAGLDREAL
jgi:DivIVA domain-containing protein